MNARPVLDPLPDVERLVANFLRENDRIAALIADRVFTVFPAKAGNDPLLILQRVGGFVPFSNPLVVESCDLQMDSYGGTKQAAQELASLTRAVLTELEGAVRPEGVASAVRFGAFRWMPDETFAPPRPRYVFDVTITVRTTVVPVAGLTESETEVPVRTRASV